MSQRLNRFGQPIGQDVPHWQGAQAPNHRVLQGRYCRLEPLGVTHCADLFAAFNDGKADGLWTYMPVGPFDTEDDFRDWVAGAYKSTDPLFYALIDLKNNRAVGIASFLRINPDQGVIEVGFIAYAPCLQKTRAATEIMYLMMRHVFKDLGFRRYEWKCDALNAKSRAAALRLGFSYDGLFKQALVYKGRNRDTAWYSVLDRDWPALKQAYENWLDPANFDETDAQKTTLAAPC